MRNKTQKRSKMNFITCFIKNMFSLQLTLKMIHWSTKSYSLHKATDVNIQKLLPLIDEFVEAFLGKNNHKLKQNSITNIKITSINNKKKLNEFINTNIKYLASLDKVVTLPHNSDLASIRDDIIKELNVLMYLTKLS